MKRIISLSVICAMLLSVIGFFVRAAGITVSVGTAACPAGGSVSVPIVLSGNTGFSNLGIEIEYDDTAMTLTNVTAGQTGATYTAAQSISTNPYNMGWDSTSNNTFNGTIATLEFEIAANAAPGNYPITAGCYKGRNGDYEDGIDVNYDEDFNSLDLSYVTGYVTVSAGAASSKSISVSDIRNDGALSFEAELRSDEQISGVVIAAVYDYDGRLIAAERYNAATAVDFGFINVHDAAMVKVFWWESISGMTPIANTKAFRL